MRRRIGYASRVLPPRRFANVLTNGGRTVGFVCSADVGELNDRCNTSSCSLLNRMMYCWSVYPTVPAKAVSVENEAFSR